MNFKCICYILNLQNANVIMETNSNIDDSAAVIAL